MKHVLPKSLAVAMLAAGCGAPSMQDGGVDAGKTDSGVSDSGVADSGVSDAGMEVDMCPSGCFQLRDADGGLVYYPDGGPYCLC